jgi:AraC-like DNA-binding protein
MNTLLFLAGIFGLVLSTVFVFKKSTQSKASFFLGFFYVIISVYTLQTYVIEADLLNTYRWFYVWPLVVFNLIMVPIYFYFITILKDGFEWKNGYFLLFFPFFFGMIDIIYVFTSPQEIYDTLVNVAITKTEDRLTAEYFLFSLNEHYLMRHLWQLGSLLILWPDLRLFLKERTTTRLKEILNKWLVLFWLLLVLFSCLSLLHGMERLFAISFLNYVLNIPNGHTIIIFILYFIAFILCIIPMYFTTILHGYSHTKKYLKVKAGLSKQENEFKYSLNMEDIKLKLETIIENKTYLRQDFTVSTCAKEMDMPPHHLSYFISTLYGMNFAQFKNSLRVDYSKDLMAKGFLEQSTIEALAQECGFGDRSSFSKTFKTITSHSPSEYHLK